jgi:anti-anti-sigma regulatory factor
MADDEAGGVSFHDLSQGGASGRLIREKDWSQTSLGPRSAWGRSLANHVSMILELPGAAIIFWGPEQVQLYNDGYSVIMGPRHPRHLGSTFRECWPEAYDAIHPWMQRVLQKGETVSVNRTLVSLTRHGFAEEAYFTFSFTPLRDDAGKIAGVLQLVTEVTGAVLGERRTAVLHELASQTAHAKTMEDAATFTTRVLSRDPADLPFAVLYAVEPKDRRTLRRVGSTGLAEGAGPFPETLEVLGDKGDGFPELARAGRERRSTAIDDLAARMGPGSVASAELPTRALVSPLVAGEEDLLGVLLIGLSPRLQFDDRYRDFVGLVSAHISGLLMSTRTHQDEKRRLEAQAEVIRELSTPVLQLGEHLLVLPLIGLLDAERIRLATSAMLRAIRTHRAHTVILDVTGVPQVDTQVAGYLARGAEAARLMGADILVTGVSSETAETLVTLGVDLPDIRTFATLRDAVGFAQKGNGRGLIGSSGEPPNPGAGASRTA